MKRKLTLLALTSVSIFSALAVVVSSVAWFASGTKIAFGSDPNNVNVSGGSVASYYESGDGSFAKKFVISDKIHLYNLAWLQYIGYYNAYKEYFQKNAPQNIYQYYFVLKNDIDMDGLTIPPIGTEKYPFLGNFDGQGHTISNFTVSNDNPVPVSSDFGVAKPAKFYGGQQSEIVGFFGVVGKLPNQLITYDTSMVSVANVTLSNFTVKARTSQLLIGLAAGYVDGEMSGVRVSGSATLDVNGQTSTSKSGITSKLSDYGLVGYTTKIDTNGGSYKQKLSEYFSQGGDGSGTDPSWGGSINVKNYNHWFYYLSGQSAYDGSKAMSTSGSNTITGTGFKGVFSAYSVLDPESDYLYYRRSNTDYIKLYADGTGLFCNSGTNVNITSWSDSVSGSVYGYKLDFASNVTYGSVTQQTFYLNHQNTAPTSNLAIYRQASHTGTTVSNTGMIKSSNQYSQQHALVYRGQSGLYLPLKFSSETWYDQVSNAVADDNTGYIVGATGSSTTNGAVKISSYPLHHIINSISDTSYEMLDVCMGHGSKDAVFDDSKLEILTYKEGSGWVLIKDSHNSEHSVANSKISTYTKSDATTPDVLFTDAKKYNKSRDKLNTEILRGAKRVHAIHFDTPASGYGIGGNNNITSYSNVKVNNSSYASYQMPAGTVNFNLKERGIINFFAGAYNTSDVNMSFFSLYKVTRNNSNAISSIDEIRSIYLNPNFDGTNDKYLYSYDANIPSGATSSDLIKNLDNSLRISSVPVKNALYYFELPVNSGEYCMAISSSSSNQGAYMMFLDIGTSGEDKDEIRAHHITTINNSNPYPEGVDFAPVTVSGNGGETIGVSISSGNKGVLTFEVATANIAITDASSIATYSFQGTKYSASSPPSGNFSVSGNSPGALPSLSEGGTRVLSIHVGTVAGDEYDVLVSDIFSDLQGTISSTTYELDDGTGFKDSSESEIEDLSPDLDLSALRNLVIVATLTRTDGNGAFFATYDEDNSYYEGKIVDVDMTMNGSKMSVAVTTGYTFKIAGATITNGATYPAAS